MDARDARRGPCLQLALTGTAVAQALGDVPGRFVFWRLDWRTFPYLDRGVEYPVVVGYLSWVLASITGSAGRFFIANGAIDVVLAVAMTCLIRVGGDRRIWRWIAAPPLLVRVPQLGLARSSPRSSACTCMRTETIASRAVHSGRCIHQGVPGPVPRPTRDHAMVPQRPAGAIRLVAWAGGVLLVLNGPMLVLDHADGGTRRNSRAVAARHGARCGSGCSAFPTQQRSRTPTRPESQTRLAGVVLLAFLVAISILGVRRNLDAIAIGAAATAAFVLANKVYSPNYDIWLVPFFVLLPVTRRHWLAFCAGDIGVYLLVYGHFRDYWSSHTVVKFLLPFVLLRAGAIVLLIVVALRRRIANRGAGNRGATATAATMHTAR